jgi:hypothetical protein
MTPLYSLDVMNIVAWSLSCIYLEVYAAYASGDEDLAAFSSEHTLRERPPRRLNNSKITTHCTT